jgi:hypothetical protein
MTLIKKIGKVALKTLGWVAVPEVMSVITYCQRDSYDEYDAPLPEMGIFVLATAITVGATFGTNKLYDNFTNKRYSTKNITIEVKHNPSLEEENEFFGNISYALPIVRVALMKNAKDITRIKTKNLTMEIENTNIITFDEAKGFSLNKEAYYNDNFRILKKKGNDFEDPKWIEYNQNENITVGVAYEKIKNKSDKIRDKAIRRGDIGQIIELQDSMIKIENDYEFKKIALKKTQLDLDAKLTDVINQLNTEYATYINTPASTAIPKRDYQFTK